jgi:5'-nucleotidase
VVNSHARLLRALVAGLVAVALLASCSSDSDDDEAADETSETTAPAEPLQILLVNDDGIINPAIDVMLGLLAAEGDVEITVVAPAAERSGSSDKTTPGGATYQEGTTPAGVKGYAVNGFPADSVIVALDQLHLDPDLVLSGVNPGQNIGVFASLSGTVGVGRTAIRRGIPALAVSAGLELDQEQFLFAANLAKQWIDAHRDALLAGTAQADTVTSINVPACPVAKMGKLQEVPRATAMPEGVNVFQSTCDQRDPAPANDVAALVAGYPSLTQVPADI